ncbi:MAG TPA: acyltransferase [Solirubrobacteraceae bacterium]
MSARGSGLGRSGRLHSLDGLRALAVVMVFASHVHQSTLTGGFIGVDVFFVLSGYLITWMLLREHAATGAISLPRFYMRRVLRLYPALIGTVILATLLALYFGWGRPGWDALAASTYVMDFYGSTTQYFSPLLHTWSLAVEEQFYLVWPAILLVGLRKGWNMPRVVIGLIAASIAVTAFIGLAHVGYANRVQYLPCSHLTELGTGILLAFAVQSGNLGLVRRLSGTTLTAVCIVLLFVGLYALPSRWWAFPLVVLVCWPPVAHLVTRPETWISRAFSLRGAVWLGERSYGFYLWHYPILAAILSSGLVHGVTPAAVVACLIATELSWRFIEQPFLRMKQRFEPTTVPPAHRVWSQNATP